MSLVTINDVKDQSCGFDIEGTIKCMSSPRYVNLRNGEVACVSDALLSDEMGHMIKFALWNDDIKKVRNNIKIRIKNTYAKFYQKEVILYKSKNGVIDIFGFNPNRIFDDVEKFQRYHKNINSIEQYYNFVKISKSEIYLGVKKSYYLEIIDAFLTIQQARKLKIRKNRAELAAIHFLHKIITLSPVHIRQTLGLFGIDIDIERILRISEYWDEERFMRDISKINHKISHKIDEKDGEEIYHFEYVLEGLSNDLVIEDQPRNDDSDRPLCEGNLLEFHRKYKGYIDYYADPW